MNRTPGGRPEAPLEHATNRRQVAAAAPPPRTAAEILGFLTPDLRATLAGLYRAPEAVATATVQLLPFGSRAALVTLEPPLAREGQLVDEHGRHNLVLTRFCYEVMFAAAASEEERILTPDWDRRAAQAAATIHGRARH